MAEEDNKGLPIYLEPVDRKVADLVAEGEAEVNAWYPSNKAAHKLWRCLECLRDIDELLEEAIHLKSASKKKRRLKIAVTPLHSLILALDDLLNDIQSNKETSNQLTADQIKQINQISKQFGEMLPHDNKAPVSVLRNKLSSHVDKKLHPYEARAIADIISPSEFGRWLHICIHLVLDLTKLDIYTWTCDSPASGYVRFMTNEPFIVTFKTQGNELSALVGLHIAKSSPRNCIPTIVDSIIKHSEWMFKPNQPHITSLKEDSRENWNTFLGNFSLEKSYGPNNSDSSNLRVHNDTPKNGV
jgi:hypothetical protein